MPGSSHDTPKEPRMVPLTEMARLHEESGFGSISRQRLWDLARSDPNWPTPPDQAPRVGRIPLFDWNLFEPYFAGREKQQGKRNDLPSKDVPPTE